MSETPPDRPIEGPAEKRRRLREAALRTDSKPSFVNAAKLFRRVLPGDDRYGDPLSTAGEGLPGRVGRAVADLRAERPSALRELSLGALQAWQAMAEAQNRGRGAVDVAILFTDLAGFSSWALSAGDTATLELLRGVGAAEEHAVVERGGTIVKRLGDGAMAVFVDPRQAVEAALELQRELSKIQVAGYVPELRAGVHVGRPRRIGRDYLGVDVNVAARVGDAAKAGEILVSDSACRQLEASGLRLGRRRRLKAPGVPTELSVCVVPEER